MIRTTRGLSLLDKIAKPRQFWKILGNFGIVCLFIGMIGMLCFLFLAMDSFLTTIQTTGMPEPNKFNAPRNIFLVPGVNEFLPIVWGSIALIASLGLHELGHAITCRAENIKMKSMGILLAVVPVGGFAEPDEKEIEAAPQKSRIRIYCAGITMNFLLTLICFSLLFGPVLGAIAPVGETMVTGVLDNGPAKNAGLQPDMLIQTINGQHVNTVRDLVKNLDRIEPGETVTITGIKNREVHEYIIIANSSYPEVIEGVEIISLVPSSPAEDAGLTPGTFIISVDNIKMRNAGDFISFMDTTIPGQEIQIVTFYPENNTEIHSTALLMETPDNGSKDNSGYLGVYYDFLSGNSGTHLLGINVGAFQAQNYLESLRQIPSQLTTPMGWFLLLSLPIYGLYGEGFVGFSGTFQEFFTATSWAAPFGIIWFWFANALLWTGWLSLYVGMFNCLPSRPLDGGYVFREYTHNLITRITKNPEKSELVANKIINYSSLLLIGMMLFMITGPYIIHGL